MEITTEKAVINAVASAEMEGFRFTSEEIERIKNAIENRLSPAEFLSVILQTVKES